MRLGPFLGGLGLAGWRFGAFMGGCGTGRGRLWVLIGGMGLPWGRPGAFIGGVRIDGLLLLVSGKARVAVRMGGWRVVGAR